jgi:transcriptional regulator with GAF, ATPase, and Fis domain/tetratricopeptide (TPR) repeat protein
VHRAIPPDSSHARLPIPEGVGQREAIGDLHLAADNFAAAAAEYHAALRELGHDVPGERCRVLLRLAETQDQGGDWDAAIRTLSEARALARDLGDPRLKARVASGLALALISVGQYRRSRRYGHYAYAILRNTDEHQAVARVEATIGLCYTRLGRPNEAIEWLQNAAATFRRIDDPDGLARSLNNLGLVYKNLREWREATRFLEQALRIDERAGLYALMRLHNQNLGLIRYCLGQWDLAEENFRRSLQIAIDTQHRQGEAMALMALGRLCRRRRQLDRAEELFRRALRLAVEANARRETVLAREFLAEVELNRDNPSAALQLLESALADAVEIAPEGDMVAEIENRMGFALLYLGRVDEGQTHLLRGVSLTERLGDRLEQAIAERGLARLEAMRGDAAGLDARIRAAAQCFEQLTEKYELAVTLATWSELLLLLPTSQRMRVTLEPVADAARRAAALFRELGVLPLAAEALLTHARLQAEREHYDAALSMLEQAELWLGESGDAEVEERAATLRREIERQYVAVSLSTCNEFRALEDANRLFRDATDMNDLLARTVRLAVENAGGDRGFVAFSSGGGRLDVVAQHGMGRDRARRVLQVMEATLGAKIAESGPMFSSRLAADPRFTGALGGALEGVGSLVCVPLNFPSQSVGIVYVDRFNDNLLGAFKQRELNLLAVLASSAAVAIVESQRSFLFAENQALRQQLRSTPGLERVVGQSREMSDILNLLAKVGDSNATVLFMGETGTGKGLLAQVLHELSGRREHSFVQVNCAALPEQLLESELFGYVHGAFTGAVRDKAGLFEEAEGGTIFLDEIEKVPESVQAKLLHVLDRGEIRPVGSTRSRKVDARVICATGVDLRERIRSGRFLEDLYYRLNDITVRVPSLRERREDIPILAQHFLEMFSKQMEKRIRGFSPAVLRAFLDWEWRGNVRELEKTVKRMVVLADEGDSLEPPLLPGEMRETPVAVANGDNGYAEGKDLRTNVAQLERRMIAETLERVAWNKARAARELGLSYPTMLAKIRTFKIERRRGT